MPSTWWNDAICGPAPIGLAMPQVVALTTNLRPFGSVGRSSWRSGPSAVPTRRSVLPSRGALTRHPPLPHGRESGSRIPRNGWTASLRPCLPVRRAGLRKRRASRLPNPGRSVRIWESTPLRPRPSMHGAKDCEPGSKRSPPRRLRRIRRFFPLPEFPWATAAPRSRASTIVAIRSPNPPDPPDCRKAFQIVSRRCGTAPFPVVSTRRPAMASSIPFPRLFGSGRGRHRLVPEHPSPFRRALRSSPFTLHSRCS